jgi:hypothetical protein
MVDESHDFRIVRLMQMAPDHGTERIAARIQAQFNIVRD